MRVWIVGDNFGFPNGSGATARVHGFVRALQGVGAGVRVVCVTPTEVPGRRSLNTAAQGIHDGIPFEYTCGTTTLPTRFFERRWLRVRSAFRTWWSARRARPDVVIATAQTLSGLLLPWLVARAVGAACVLDACELPSGFLAEGPRRDAHRRLYARLARRLDGILVVSSVLERYFGDQTRVPMLRVPILVEMSRFARAVPVEDAHRIVYAGNLAHPEEITSLLEAFAAVAQQEPDARLQVLGDDPNSNALVRFPALAADLGVAHRVEFTGSVDRATAARLVAQAGVLALPRPATPWAEAGLSTKLAEYLATARPVVVTAVGDIPLYLEDRVHAFLVPPHDPGAFGVALRDALRDPVRAEAVGEQGRDAAARQFEVSLHGPRIARFFESLRRAPAD